MYDIGRVCYKIAGRDSNKVCVIVDTVDARHVLVDGQTRRKAVNVAHLEPTAKSVDLRKGAAHEAVVKALEGVGFKVEKKGAARKAAARPLRQKAVRKAEKKEVKAPVKETKAEKPAKSKKTEAK
jgi:large subunit ribosomal protein L14e